MKTVLVSIPIGFALGYGITNLIYYVGDKNADIFERVFVPRHG